MATDIRKTILIVLIAIAVIFIGNQKVPEQSIFSGDFISVQEFQAAAICGNGVCQGGESPLNCNADCAANLDELFCWIGDTECDAWVFNSLIYTILGMGLWVLIRKK